MTNQEITTKGLRLIEKVITLKCNVKNGCYSDQAELNKEFPRLEGFKKWAIENNQIATVQNYMNKNWGMHRQFVAAEIKTFFNS